MRDRLLFFILAAVALDGLAALIGGILPPSWVRPRRRFLMGFASGVLIGAALLELLPEAIAQGGRSELIFSLVAFGFGSVFLVEWAMGGNRDENRALAPALLLGDALHNIADGVAVATAFLAGTELGIATAIAVFFHELPQEASDYVILLDQGYSRQKALFLLVAVQFTALGGALGVYFGAQWVSDWVPELLALAAGGFLYLGAVDLLPRRSWSGTLAFFAGVTLIAVL